MNQNEKDLAFFCRFMTGYHRKKCSECDFKEYCRKDILRNYDSISEYYKLNGME